MMLHQDGLRQGWLEGQAPFDLIVTMDDATSTIYSAFLAEEEGTASTFCGLLEVFVAHGLPSALYTDRGSHYFYTDKAGEAVDKDRRTQVGRALDRLGVEHIPAYSPEARGRSEADVRDAAGPAGQRAPICRSVRHRDGERMDPRGLSAAAQCPLRQACGGRREGLAAVDPGLLSETLCVEEERVVGLDNTVACEGLKLQLPESSMRASA
jgi:hypothetical protein